MVLVVCRWFTCSGTALELGGELSLSGLCSRLMCAGLSGWVSQEICHNIGIVKPPVAGLTDFPSWDLSSSGQFTLKSAYPEPVRSWSIDCRIILCEDNIDGSHLKDGGSALLAGGWWDVLTVHLLWGSIANSVSGNAIWAELWGLRRGIDLAKQLNLSWVIFELDSKVVVDMVKAGGSAVVYLNPLIQEIRALPNHPCWRVSFVHAYREGS